LIPSRIKFQFEAILWEYSGKGAWVFVSLPQELSLEIRTELKNLEEGWGRMRTEAQIGQSIWKTALWFDTKSNTYLLAVKAEIRKKEKIEIGNLVKVTIAI
jgi:hypothetical protein